jgi:hypothetical protein
MMVERLGWRLLLGSIAVLFLAGFWRGIMAQDSSTGSETPPPPRRGSGPQ